MANQKEEYLTVQAENCTKAEKLWFKRRALKSVNCWVRILFSKMQKYMP